MLSFFFWFKKGQRTRKIYRIRSRVGKRDGPVAVAVDFGDRLVKVSHSRPFLYQNKICQRALPWPALPCPANLGLASMSCTRGGAGAAAACICVSPNSPHLHRLWRSSYSRNVTASGAVPARRRSSSLSGLLFKIPCRSSSKRKSISTGFRPPLSPVMEWQDCT